VKHFIPRVLGGVLAAFALGFPAVPAQAAALPKEVTIASIGTMHEGKVTVTSQSARVQEERWLEQELARRGVTLKWYPVASSLGGPAFNEGLINRKVDFASYGVLPSLIGKSGGVDIRLIVPYGGIGNTYLAVPVGSPARSIQDLKGKRIALQRGRPAELPFYKLITAHGLRMSDFRIMNLPMTSGASALAAGNVDAYYGSSDAFTLEDKKVGRIIWSTKDAIATRDGSWKTRVDLYARKEFIDQYPEITQLVATAYVRSAYWTAQEENRADVVRIYARPGTPPSAVERDLAGDGLAWREHFAPIFDQNLYRFFDDSAAIATEARLIRKPVKSQDLLDRRFADRALQELQIAAFWDVPAARTASAEP